MIYVTSLLCSFSFRTPTLLPLASGFRLTALLALERMPIPFLLRYVSLPCCLVTKSCLTLCDPMDCSTQGFLSFIISLSLLKLMSTVSVMPSNQLILCHPLILLSSIFPSIWVFSNDSALRIRWPKYWSFSFSISPPNEYSGLISFRTDCFDLLAVQGTLKSHLKHHNSKVSILRHSTLFMVKFSHLYMTTGKTIALTTQIFVGKMMSLPFNTLSRFVIAFFQGPSVF